jgi:HK97 family phage portal protein
MLNKVLDSLAFWRKESKVTGAMLTFGLDTPVWTPRDYEHLTRVGYQMNADVYACVNLITRGAKPVPWLVTKGPGGKAVPESHPLVKLLDKPNERESGSDFKESALAYLLLSGNSYIERSGGSETTPPAFLYAHRPDRMQVIKGNRRAMVGGYTYKAGGEPIKFEPWEILHLRLFNPLDDFYGMSPLEAAAYTIDIANEASILYKRLIQKGYPPGAVTVKGVNYTDQQLADLRVGLKRAADNGDVLLLQDAEWKEMGFKPVDSSLFEGKLYAKRDIAAVYGVPSGMIGDTQVKTYANSREERRSLYTEAVIPHLTKLMEGLNTWLCPLYPDNPYIDIDKDAIDALAEDREVQSKRVSLLFTTGIIKRSEAREEMKYEAIPDDEDGFFNEINAPPEPKPLPASTVTIDATHPLPPGKEPAQIAATNGNAKYLKSFNLLSEQEKVSHWNAVESRRELWAARANAAVEARFKEEASVVIRTYRDHGETAALRAVAKQEDEWHTVYKRIVVPVAEDFARHTLQSIKAEGYDAWEVKFELDIFTSTVLKWLTTEGAKRVVAVLDTTKDSIRKELATGVAAGEGIYQLTKRLTAMYNDFSMVRAERIARTEVISASNLGSQIAAKATNLPLWKEWIATKDDRVRDAHWEANGQKQKIDVPYTVMGEKLMFPGDGSLGASASNLIQCRCVESYVVRRDLA